MAQRILSKNNRILVLGVLLLAILTVSVPAQTKKPTPTPTIPRALPVEKPKEKKPGFFGRIFRGKPTPTPTLAPIPTTRPRPTKRPVRPRPTPRPTATLNATNAPNAQDALDAGDEERTSPSTTGTSSLPDTLPPLEDAADTLPAASLPPTPAPASPEVLTNPLNQPIPLIGDAADAPASPTPEPAAAALERQTLRRIQFRKVRAEAHTDPKVRELKSQADTATQPADRVAALKAYYPALFAAMRKIDESLSVDIDEMEAASRRRIERLESEGVSSVPPAN